jgi:hypothetical protein
MATGFCAGAARLWERAGAAVRRTALVCLAPAPGRPTGVARGFLADLLRTPEELHAENAFLRHQLTVATRGSRKPQFHARDRFLLVALSRMFSSWRDALVLVKPDTLLRWHRDGFRLLWMWRSRKESPAPPRVPPDVVDLIRRMATENRLWGAERIRGELLKLDIAVAKRTIQRYMSKAAARRPTVSVGPPFSVRRQLASGPVTSSKSATSGFAATTSSSSSISRPGSFYMLPPP